MKCSMKSHKNPIKSDLILKKLRSIAIRHVQLIHVVHGQARDSRLGSGASVFRTGYHGMGQRNPAAVYLPSGKHTKNYGKIHHF